MLFRSVAEAEGFSPLAPGQRLASPGLAARGLTRESQALELVIGGSRWLILPNRQALWSWRDSGRPAAERLWVGFVPGPGDRRLLHERGVQQAWLSGALPRRSPPLASGWQATGHRGFLSSNS